MLPEVGWETIPEELLVSVFQYLQPGDLVRASNVCIKWKRVFEEPQLWRSCTFMLNNNRKELNKSLQVMEKILDMMGKYVKELYIVGPDPEIGDRLEPLRCTYLVRILHGLSDRGTSTLTAFSVQDVFGDLKRGTRRNNANRGRVVQELGNFLETLTELKILELRWSHLSEEYSGLILNSLARSKCLETLDYLDLVCFFVAQNHGDGTRNQLNSVFTSCQKLRVLEINYSYLQAVGVEALCETLKDTFEWLLVDTYHPEDSLEYMQKTAISPQQWRSAVLHCPGLKVGLELPHWRTDLRMYLVPGIPLAEVVVNLDYEAEYSEELGDTASILLDHITKYYSKTLELVRMSNNVEANPVSTLTTESLVRCVQKCNKIQNLTFCPKLMTPVLIQFVRAEVGDGLIEDLDIIKIN